MGGGAVPIQLCGGRGICMDGGVHPYKCVTVAVHAAGFVLVLFIEKGILQEEQFGMDKVSAVMAMSNLSCL